MIEIKIRPKKRRHERQFVFRTEAAVQWHIPTDFGEGPSSFPALTPLVLCCSGAAPAMGCLPSACPEHLHRSMDHIQPVFPDQSKWWASFWFENLQHVKRCQPVLTVLSQFPPRFVSSSNNKIMSKATNQPSLAACLPPWRALTLVLRGATGTSLVETQSSTMPVSPATITSQGGSSSRQDMKRALLSPQRKQCSTNPTASTPFKKSRKAWPGPGS